MLIAIGVWFIFGVIGSIYKLREERDLPQMYRDNWPRRVLYGFVFFPLVCGWIALHLSLTTIQEYRDGRKSRRGG
jgi:hypothetical protein